jgi:hypothetical protein
MKIDCYHICENCFVWEPTIKKNLKYDTLINSQKLIKKKRNEVDSVRCREEPEPVVLEKKGGGWTAQSILVQNHFT